MFELVFLFVVSFCAAVTVVEYVLEAPNYAALCPHLDLYSIDLFVWILIFRSIRVCIRICLCAIICICSSLVRSVFAQQHFAHTWDCSSVIRFLFVFVHASVFVFAIPHICHFLYATTFIGL